MNCCEMLSCYMIMFAFIGFVSPAIQVEQQEAFRTNCQEIQRVYGVMNGIDQKDNVKSLPKLQEIKEKLEKLPIEVEEFEKEVLEEFDKKMNELENKFDKDEEATKQRLNSGEQLPEGKKICVTEIRSSLHNIRNSYSMSGCYNKDKLQEALVKITELDSKLKENHAKIEEYRKQLDKGCNECCNDGDIVTEIEGFLRKGPNVNEEFRTISSLVDFEAVDRCMKANKKRTEEQVELRRLYHLCCLA